MSDEYNNIKIETKAADSSSGSYAPPQTVYLLMKFQNKNYIMQKVFGLVGYLVKMPKLLECNML